ncbi:molybdate ABC transporter substrate-binding protein [Nakamurella sp. PAMC28650]|uniref:molybdate ABC transporter substrate-binding protein n=1 Tax=Nakamurella sp. PAMC28650 TaxID=2762325 RepID=UPI0021020EE6|nr:molybdate ABC transporter substrate-binding protein [Nakamurella sp. PAMC28650]
MSRIRLKSTPVLAAIAVGALVLSACSSTSSTTAAGSGATSSAASSAAAPLSTAPLSSAPLSSAPLSFAPMSSAGAKVTGTLKVDAAASLKKTFDKLATEFEAEHPGVKVSVSYDGSAVLATQLIGGAPVDVFASADKKNMTKVTDKKLITSTPIEFATNTLQIAVAPGNPRKIASLKDLTASGLNVDLCAVAQPCGAAAQTALKAAGVTVKPISMEQSVTAVLTKVESGDADAGLVYKTDVLGASGKVTGVDFAESSKAVNHYPIAALDAAPNPTAAKAFIALVTGAAGQKILAAAGFGAPGA